MNALISESTEKVLPALLAAKKTFKPAVKDQLNPHFQSAFLSLAGVLQAVEDALLANDLMLMQPTAVIDGQTVLCSRIVHSSGEWVGSEYPVRSAGNNPQAEGSALTYARRYAAMALLGIAPEDDDGNAATAAAKRQDSRPAEKPLSGVQLDIDQLRTERNLAWSDVRDEYAAWSQGGSLNEASDSELTRFYQQWKAAA